MAKYSRWLVFAFWAAGKKWWNQKPPAFDRPAETEQGSGVRLEKGQKRETTTSLATEDDKAEANSKPSRRGG